MKQNFFSRFLAAIALAKASIMGSEASATPRLPLSLRAGWTTRPTRRFYHMNTGIPYHRDPKPQAAVRKSRRRLHGAGVKNAFRKL